MKRSFSSLRANADAPIQVVRDAKLEVKAFHAVMNSGVLSGNDVESLALVSRDVRSHAIDDAVWKTVFDHAYPNSPLGDRVSPNGYRSLYWLLEDGPVSREDRPRRCDVRPSCEAQDLVLIAKIFREYPREKKEHLKTVYVDGKDLQELLESGTVQVWLEDFVERDFPPPKIDYKFSVKMHMYRRSDMVMCGLMDEKLPWDERNRDLDMGWFETDVDNEDDWPGYFIFQTDSVLGKQLYLRTEGARIFFRTRLAVHDQTSMDFYLSHLEITAQWIEMNYRDGEIVGDVNQWRSLHGRENGFERFGVTLLHLLSELKPNPPMARPSQFD